MRQKISWTDGQTDRGKTVYPPPPSGSGSIKKKHTRNHPTLVLSGQIVSEKEIKLQSLWITDNNYGCKGMTMQVILHARWANKYGNKQEIKVSAGGRNNNNNNNNKFFIYRGLHS
jgi:hypothetical protein